MLSIDNAWNFGNACLSVSLGAGSQFSLRAVLILHTIRDKVESRSYSFVILPRFATIIEFQSSTYIMVSVYTAVNVRKVEKFKNRESMFVEVKTKFVHVRLK